jgi:acetylornithine deacetylase/succinyl-diaminopimelate desuccinylase-like protein
MHFDLRLLPDLVVSEIEKHIQQGIQAIAGKYPSLNLSVVRERMNPGLNMTMEHELVKTCKSAMEDAGIEPVFDRGRPVLSGRLRGRRHRARRFPGQ